MGDSNCAARANEWGHGRNMRRVDRLRYKSRRDRLESKSALGRGEAPIGCRAVSGLSIIPFIERLARPMTNLAADLLSISDGIDRIDVDQWKRGVNRASCCSAPIPPKWMQRFGDARGALRWRAPNRSGTVENRTGNGPPPAEPGTPVDLTRRRRTSDPETGKSSTDATNHHDTSRRTEHPSFSSPFSPSNPG